MSTAVVNMALLGRATSLPIEFTIVEPPRRPDRAPATSSRATTSPSASPPSKKCDGPFPCSRRRSIPPRTESSSSIARATSPLQPAVRRHVEDSCRARRVGDRRGPPRFRPGPAAGPAGVPPQGRGALRRAGGRELRHAPTSTTAASSSVSRCPNASTAKSSGRVWSFRDLTERKELEDQLVYRAFHDELTGLAEQGPVL